MNTGDKIKALRLKNKMTLEELGNRVGVGKSTVRKWEAGAIKNMGRDKVASLARVFNVSPTYLITDDNDIGRFQLPDNWLQFYADQDEYTEEEQHLVRLYRRADDIDKRTVMTVLSRYEDVEDPTPPVKMIRHYIVPAAAGYAAPIEGEEYEEIPLPADAPAGADFCIDISGDSMEPYIHDGQRVYIKRDAQLQEFDPGVFYVDGDVFCKQWAPGYAGEMYLLSANPKRQDANITITRDSGRTCICFGKVLLRQRLPQPYYEK